MDRIIRLFGYLVVFALGITAQAGNGGNDRVFTPSSFRVESFSTPAVKDAVVPAGFKRVQAVASGVDPQTKKPVELKADLVSALNSNGGLGFSDTLYTAENGTKLYARTLSNEETSRDGKPIQMVYLGDVDSKGVVTFTPQIHSKILLSPLRETALDKIAGRKVKGTSSWIQLEGLVQDRKHRQGTTFGKNGAVLMSEPSHSSSSESDSPNSGTAQSAH